MEAATAGQAPAGAEGGQVDGGQPQEGAPDIGQWQQSVDQQLNSANDTIRELASGFQQYQQQVMERLPEPAAAPSFEDQFSEIFGEVGQNGGFIEPQQLQGLQGLVQQQIEQGIEQRIAPVMEQMTEFQQQMSARDLQGLTQQFPELQDQQAADALAGHVVDAALSVVPRGTSPQVAEALMQNKDFVALVHLAEKARGAAQQETPAGQGQNVPQIETGAGAAPPSTSGADEWDSFVQQRRPSSQIW